jgi:predicted hydrocarbon binding protein
MSERSPFPEETSTPAPSQETDDDGFRADLPLAILESVRHHDRPTEVLEEEDLAASLPRRLGLTGVVESQIHRYKIARRRRERIPSDDVADLLRLVLRRPDAAAILVEAGRELARHHGRKLLYRIAGLARILPDAISTRIAKRSIRRLMRRLAGSAEVRVTRRPLRVTAHHPVTALADDSGTACTLYAAAIEEAAQHSLGRRPSVQHVECEAFGADHCVWELDIS